MAQARKREMRAHSSSFLLLLLLVSGLRFGIPFELLETRGSYSAQVRETAWSAEADASGRGSARHGTTNLAQTCVGAAALIFRRAAVWRPLDVGDVTTGLARAQLAAAVLAVTLSLADLFDFTKRRRGIESGHLAHQSVDVVEAVGGGTGSGELLACLADSEADGERSRLGA